MQSNPQVFVNSTENGIKRVKKENYAFLVESIANEYDRYRDCELIQIGDFLDTKSYAFGLTKGSVWREKISNAILMLEDKGKIEEIYQKWWRKVDALDCEQKLKLTQVPQFNISNLAGLFILLFIGMVVAFFLALIEHAFKKNKTNIPTSKVRIKQRAL